MVTVGPNEVVRHARALVGLGLAVVPLHPLLEDGTCSCRKRRDCKTPGKHPRILWKDRPAEPPATDELERWWAMWPDSGLGCILGHRHCALDVDRHPGGADGPAQLAALEREHGALPVTWRARTSNGGLHIYFANHGRFTSVHQVAPGVQLRAGRHVMVLPPSLGRGWLTSPRAPIADLPVWMADLTQRSRLHDRASGHYRVSGELAPDNRHPAYVRIALELARMNLPLEVIAEMLEVVDRRLARPPKGDRGELERIAAWAFGKAHEAR